MPEINGNAMYTATKRMEYINLYANFHYSDGSDTPLSNGDYSINYSYGGLSYLVAFPFNPSSFINDGWVAETSYNVNDVIFIGLPYSNTSFVMKVTGAVGSYLSDLVEPTWNTTTDSTTIDGDLTWTCLGSLGDLMPVVNYCYLTP